ncbi:MAG TPA: MerR family transcriptional regulator [Gaiellaceae bacterium]|jgi:DNA-binding transcriptional MerR regulator|nr:MerR family transcriptional regulator [Gaiellaceae bacterium]
MSTMTNIPQRERPIRIGEVVRRLHDEFPDISISKIRFLEDEGLLSPERTRGGYRLFSEGDVERLVTILRLQRDEFLPLRVIRDELAIPGATERKRRRPAGLGERMETIDFAEVCRRSGVQPELVKELDEFGLLSPAGSGAEKRYPETDVDIVIVCAQLTRYGVDGRHLRTFRTATDREAALLEQLIAPALRSRNEDRRTAGLSDLQGLTELAQELAGLLLWGRAREIASA